MSASRRLQLLEWAENSASRVIEDDYDSEYRYESLPIASLQGLDTNSRVIYIATFSKVLFPSLRLGYIVIPADLVNHFVAIRLAMDLVPGGFFRRSWQISFRKDIFLVISGGCAYSTTNV
jgi:GntR family transcriptional regulator/MocR family aminotransferase